MKILGRLLYWLLLSAATVVSAATVDGIQLYSSVSGKGPKTVILVHGWTCDSTTWTEQVPTFSKHYRVVTLDLPGHGKSGSPTDGKFSMDLFARAIDAVRVESKADRVVLAGHSMGTPVVVRYARLYPQHTVGLVFVDGLVTLGSRERAFATPKSRNDRENLIRSMFSSATTSAMQAKILNMMLAPSEETAEGAWDATFDPAIFSGDVLEIPILGLYADKSRLGNRAYMMDHFPNLEYHEISGTGHFLMLEKPEQFNDLTMKFLSRLKY